MSSRTFPVGVDAWPSMFSAISRPVPADVAIADLRWHEAATGSIPGRKVLSDRWGWSAWSTRKLMGSDWRDPSFRCRDYAPSAHDKMAATALEWVLSQSWCVAAATEVTILEKRVDIAGLTTAGEPLIIEVKSVRSDLLSWLRGDAYPMYAHCSAYSMLAIPTSELDPSGIGPFKALEKLSLCPSWGVLLLDNGEPVNVLRHPSHRPMPPEGIRVVSREIRTVLERRS